MPPTPGDWPRTRSADRRARAAAAGAYLVQGLCFAALLTRVPALKEKFALSDGELSVILLAVPVVAGLGSVLAGALAGRWGSAVVLRVAGPAVCLSMVAVGAVGSLPLLVAAVTGFGLAVGVVDATMNMQGVAVQRRYRRSLLMSFHGVWSLAGIAGSLATAATEQLRLPLAAGMGLVATAGIAVALRAGPALLTREQERAGAPAGRVEAPIPASPDAPRAGGPVVVAAPGGGAQPSPVVGGAAPGGGAQPSPVVGGAALGGGAPHAPDALVGAGPADTPAGPETPNTVDAPDAPDARAVRSDPRVGVVGGGVRVPWRPILLVGVAVMFTYVAESAVSNWSAVFLHDALHGSTSVAALGLGAYLTCQVVGRACADRLVGRFGPARTIGVGAVVGAVGLCVSVGAPGPLPGIGGFALAGAGLCVVVPQSFSAADAVDPDGTGVAVARVNLFNYVGFVVGAALIGAVAEAASLRLAFAVPAALALGVAALAPAFRGGPGGGRSGGSPRPDGLGRSA